MIKTLSPGMPQAALFPLGTILWRKINWISNCLQPYAFEVSEQGSWVHRVSPGRWINEPEVREGSSAFVLFVESDPGDDWTHLVVSGLSKGMRDPRIKGCCIFASVPRPYPLDDYLDFRHRYRQHIMTYHDEPIEDRVVFAQSCWPKNARPGDLRLVTNLPRYAHVSIPKEIREPEDLL